MTLTPMGPVHTQPRQFSTTITTRGAATVDDLTAQPGHIHYGYQVYPHSSDPTTPPMMIIDLDAGHYVPDDQKRQLSVAGWFLAVVAVAAWVTTALLSTRDAGFDLVMAVSTLMAMTLSVATVIATLSTLRCRKAIWISHTGRRQCLIEATTATGDHIERLIAHHPAQAVAVLCELSDLRYRDIGALGTLDVDKGLTYGTLSQIHRALPTDQQLVYTQLRDRLTTLLGAVA